MQIVVDSGKLKGFVASVQRRDESMARVGKPHPSMNRRDWMEHHIVSRRNREAAVRENWDSTSKYFHNCAVKSTKYNDLTSQAMHQSSLKAYEEIKTREANEKSLADRRAKLASLLRAENLQHQEELKIILWNNKYPAAANQSPYREPNPRATPKISEDKSVPNSPIPHTGQGDENISADLLAPRVQHDSGSQPTSKGDERRVRIYEPSNTEDVERSRPVPVEDMVGAVRRAENECLRLKSDESILLQHLQELPSRFAKRSRLYGAQQRTSYSKKLVRPYKVELQIRARQNVENVECDAKLIDRVREILQQVDDRGSDFVEDLKDIYKKLMFDVQHEIRQLENSGQLFQEEAQGLYHAKLDEWEQNKTRRDSLIEQVMKMTETILQGQLASNLERQKDNLELREHMLRNLECHPQRRQRPLDDHGSEMNSHRHRHQHQHHRPSLKSPMASPHLPTSNGISPTVDASVRPSPSSSILPDTLERLHL